jgi:hypothetical protein
MTGASGRLAFLFVLALAGPAAAYTTGSSAKIVAYDSDGRLLDAAKFAAYIGRADKRGGPAVWGWSPEGTTGQRPALAQKGDSLMLFWERMPLVTLSLPWPVADDGFSTVLVDRMGRGIANGDTIRLNEEIALTQYRLFKEAWLKHAKDRDPQYAPSSKAKNLSDHARDAIATAQLAQDPVQRAKLFDRALRDVSTAWQKMLAEHGSQIAANPKTGGSLRFGLTLDDSLLKNLDRYESIIQAAERSGSNWVRLVFRSNPADFTYEKQASFNEYDAVVKALRARNMRVMGCVLDTTQWPSSLTPPVFAERARRLALHYKDQIGSWEVGSELNGDWLGGRKTPLSTDDSFRIFQAGAAAIKSVESSLETVATLYWWEGTAPDEEHTLFGWLSKFVPRGFAKNLDVVALSLWPEDNPVGLSLERIFERTHLALPEKRLMLGSYGYVESEDLRGYWWLDPKDIDGARKDLITLLTPASCALDKSVGGGFWWQTLDQMLPSKKATDLYKVYRATVKKLASK